MIFGGPVNRLNPDMKENLPKIRELDLEQALHRVSFRKNGVLYQRETICIHPINTIIMHITTQAGGKIGFLAGLDRGNFLTARVK